MDLEQIDKHVRALVSGLDGYTYYELLAIPLHADADRVTTSCNHKVLAYRRIMGQPECSNRLREQLTVLCQRLQQACAVLCNPEQRRVYDRDGQTTMRVEDLAVHGPATFEDEEPTVVELLLLPQHQWPLVPVPEPALETRRGKHQVDEERPTEPGDVRMLGGLNPSTAVVDPESIGVFEESEDTVVDRPDITNEFDGDATLPGGNVHPSFSRRR